MQRHARYFCCFRIKDFVGSKLRWVKQTHCHTPSEIIRVVFAIKPMAVSQLWVSEFFNNHWSLITLSYLILLFMSSKRLSTFKPVAKDGRTFKKCCIVTTEVPHGKCYIIYQKLNRSSRNFNVL